MKLKYDEIRIGQFVEDTWFWDWGIGKVKEIRKTIIKIDFSVIGLITFDIPHLQFLKRACH